MSLIKCPECGKEISNKAEACPHCGCPSSYFASDDQAGNIISIGDVIEFGSYPQAVVNQREAIEWIVLKRLGNTAMCISKYGLDAHAFNSSKSKGNDWATSDLRLWLNGSFAEEAFTEDELASIEDAIFCLSAEDAAQLFNDDEDRKCLPTAFAMRRHAMHDDTRGDTCIWWLRSAGEEPKTAAVVNSAGVINEFGAAVDYDKYAVRPVIWLKIND